MTTSTFEAKQERVVRKAAELWARTSYHGTGISELCDAVGLGRGALYRYIGSKEALLFHISKTQVDRMNDHAEELLKADLPADELLREMARALIRNIATHRAEWAVFFREYTSLTGDNRDRVVAARERYEGYWRQAIDRGVADGTLKPVPRLLVKGILGMLNYTYLWFEPDGRTSSEQLADDFLDTLLDGMRSH
ncbi:TetR/AcrR family transcriptional regulator [Nocardia nepalensis]|uniref:TetR/AcrR family transcriptional regulator n=1 Tax=Nocardia nepalensis TaxID=3375448 RepID=UPI003B680E2D